MPSHNNPTALLLSERSEDAALLDSLQLTLVHLHSLEGAHAYLQENECAVVLLDVDLLVGDKRPPETSAPVIVLTGRADLPTAAHALADGAYDLALRPLHPELLNIIIQRALEHANLKRLELSYRKKLAEAQEQTYAIAKSEEFLQKILNVPSLISVVATDSEQQVLFWNKGAERIFGYSREEMIGEKITRLYPADEASAAVVEGLQRMAKQRDIAYGKMRQLTKDGREVIVSLAVSPLRTPEGEILGMVGIGQDLTEETRLQEKLSRSFDLLQQTQDVSIFSLAKLAECRDEETGRHLLRIQEYCRILCEQLAILGKYRALLTPAFIEDVVRSSVLHDIGKIAIPDSVLMSTERFKGEEFAVMQSHPLVGGQALDEAVSLLGTETFLNPARDIAFYHHERWDGSGYPFGLKGESIPLAARIVAIADVYDALVSKRRYKPALNHWEACGYIEEQKGRQFDPVVVEAFLNGHEAIEAARKRHR